MYLAAMPLDEVRSTVFPFLGAIGATVFTAFVARQLLKSRKPVRKSEVDDIAETIRSEREERAAAVAEVLAAATDPTLVPEKIVNFTMGIPVSRPIEQLINNYHEQALSQARIQFWFSVVAATIGFGWVLYGGTMIQPDKLVTVSKTFPGVVMDAVAFLFFKQAAATRERATELYDRLRRDKQLAESSVIVGSIEDVRLRSAVKAQLALHMSGLQPKEIDFSAFLSSDNLSQTAAAAR